MSGATLSDPGRFCSKLIMYTVQPDQLVQIGNNTNEHESISIARLYSQHTVHFI